MLTGHKHVVAVIDFPTSDLEELGKDAQGRGRLLQAGKGQPQVCIATQGLCNYSRYSRSSIRSDAFSARSLKEAEAEKESILAALSAVSLEDDAAWPETKEAGAPLMSGTSLSIRKPESSCAT